jgi:hypothetical protein
MTAAFAYGFDDDRLFMQLNISTVRQKKGLLEMFRDEMKRFSALKEAVKECPVSGCEIIHRPFGHVVNSYNGGNPGVPQDEWVRVAGRFGIPYTTLNGNVKLVSGKIAAALEEEEIRQMLAGGLFLDGEAAFILQNRGWGEYIGTEVNPGSEAAFCYEGIRRPEEYPNAEGKLMYNLIFAPAGSEGGSFYELKPSSGCEVITDFLDPQEQPVIPGMIRFENKLGGRVAIMAFKLGGNRSSALFSYKKKEIVRQTIEWLGKQALPVFVKDLPNVFCIFNSHHRAGAVRQSSV